MKWIGTQSIYDDIRFYNEVTFKESNLITFEGGLTSNDDIVIYNATNDGNPTISLGSSGFERLEIKAQYESGAQGLDGAIFTTYTAGSSTNDGRFTFFVDEVGTFQIKDHGINLYAGKSLQIGNTDIISDSGGTATLSNIDALDATTISTFNAALTAGDITGVTAGTGLSGGGTTGAVTLNVDEEQPGITSIGTDGDTLLILADTLLMSNTSTDTPVIKLLNTTDDDQTGQLIFEKLRDDNAVASGQNLGEIWFRGQDNAQQSEDYAYIIGEIDVSTDGEESGQLKLGVANHDGGNGNGLILTGGSEDNEIDVTVGLGANSVVTIPGDIDLAGDIDVDGTLETDALTIGGASVLAQATASAVGAVELATTAEVVTGTDTSRAVTAAGVTAHVDDRYQYVFISNSGVYPAGDMSGDDWGFPKDKQGVNYWEFDDNDDTVNYDATSFSTDRSNQHKGHVLPYDCTLIGFKGAMSSTGNNQGAFALWSFTPGYTATSAVTCTRRSYGVGSGSAWNNRAAVVDGIGGTTAGTDSPVALSAGDIIVPSLVCPNAGETTTLYMSYTIVLKIKLPDL